MNSEQIYLSIYLSVYLSVYLSIHLYEELYQKGAILVANKRKKTCNSLLIRSDPCNKKDEQ